MTPSSSLVFGFVGALCCNFAMSFKNVLHVDDAFDVFACHGVGGIVGNILTGVFAQRSVAAVDGQHIHGGWIDGHWAQVGYQVVDSAAGFAWAFGITVILLFFIDKFPGLHLKAPPEDQEVGMDRTELGESIYQHLDDICSNNVNLNNNSIIASGNFVAKSMPVSSVPQTPQVMQVQYPSTPNVMTVSTINGDMNGYGHGPPGTASANNFQQPTHFIQSNGYTGYPATYNNGGMGMVMANSNGFIVNGGPPATANGVVATGSVIGMVESGGEELMGRVVTTEHM